MNEITSPIHRCRECGRAPGAGPATCLCCEAWNEPDDEEAETAMRSDGCGSRDPDWTAPRLPATKRCNM